MTPRRGSMGGAWLATLMLAAVCAVALTAWLDPANAAAWIQLMVLCR